MVKLPKYVALGHTHMPVDMCNAIKGNPKWTMSIKQKGRHICCISEQARVHSTVCQQAVVLTYTATQDGLDHSQNLGTCPQDLRCTLSQDHRKQDNTSRSPFSRQTEQSAASTLQLILVTRHVGANVHQLSAAIIRSTQYAAERL